MSKMTTAQLIRHYRLRKGLNQSQLAKRLGLTPQAVQHWEQHNTNPKSSLIERIAQVLDVEPRDLAVGAPLRESTETAAQTHPESHGAVTVVPPAPATGAYSGVEISRLSRTSGYMDDIEAIVVSADWVSRRLPGRDPRAIKVIEAYGDAMAPTLAEGDWVLVDTSKRELNFDAVWVLRQRETGEIWIRRVQRRPDGSWALLSDNERYPSLPVAPAQKRLFDVLGQAVLRNNLAVM